MSIYVYTRISSSSQKNDSQHSEIKKDIGENKIKDIFCDVISGVSKGEDRPKWSKLNSILKAGDEVVSYRLDRFGRSAVDVISNIKELMERDIKVSIFSPKMSFDKDDYFSQFLLTLFSGLSEMERNITKERQKAGIVARREAKKKHPELLLGRRPLSPAVRKSVMTSIFLVYLFLRLDNS